MRALLGRAPLQSRFSLFRGPPRHPRPALVQLQATSAGWGLNQPLHQCWQRCAATTSAVRAAAVATTPNDVKAPFSTDIAIDQLTEKGVAQGQRPAIQALASSFLGGAMLGWGGLLMTVVAGGCVDVLTPGAIALIKGAVFPVGLSMITLSGSELLTGNMLTQSLPPIGADRAGPVARVLTLSFIGNFAGSLLVVGMAWAGGVFPATGAVASSAAALAVSKTSLAPAAAFVKGIGANWCVGSPLPCWLAAPGLNYYDNTNVGHAQACGDCNRAGPISPHSARQDCRSVVADHDVRCAWAGTQVNGRCYPFDALLTLYVRTPPQLRELGLLGPQRGEHVSYPTR